MSKDQGSGSAALLRSAATERVEWRQARSSDVYPGTEHEPTPVRSETQTRYSRGP
jgi:hypothetical protein